MKTWMLLLALLTLATPAFAFTTSPTGTTPTISYTEPTTVVGGAPITDLASTRIYWKIDAGVETMVTVPASKPAGGGVITNSSILMPILACKKGTINAAVTAVNVAGSESARMTATPLVVDRTAEASCIPSAPTNVTVQ